MNSIKFQRYYVEKSLQDYFFCSDEDRLKMRDTVKDCKDEFSSRIYLKLQLRLMYIDIEMILIEAYIQSLSEDFQKFLTYKVHDRMPMVKISFAMAASEPMLFHWYNTIIDEITHLIFYDILPDSMLFNEKLLMNLINVFNLRINFIEDNYKYAKEWLDHNWYHYLVLSRDTFQVSLQCLHDCLQKDIENNFYESVIAYKSQHLSDNISEVAAHCDTSQSRISRCFKKFRLDVYKKLGDKFFINPRPVRIDMEEEESTPMDFLLQSVDEY